MKEKSFSLIGCAINNDKSYEFKTIWQLPEGLTLIGMRGDTFISLSFLDKILSAEFLSKISIHF